MGGYGVFAKGTVVSRQLVLPPHTAVSLRFKLYKIDNWENEFFWVFIDGVQVMQQQFMAT